jgi:hypothetical protein
VPRSQREPSDSPRRELNRRREAGLVPPFKYETLPDAEDGRRRVRVTTVEGHSAVGTGDNKREAGRFAAAALIKLLSRTDCPTPQKRRYATEARATAVVHRWQFLGDHPTQPQRAYRCQCDWWHITSQP